MEKDDEHTQGKYDFGARIYDSRLGRLISVDKLHDVSPFLTPYRFAFNNPLRFIDSDGNYERDGHYWTILLMATLLELPNAEGLAYHAEAPDQIMGHDHNSIRETGTYMNKDSRVHQHAFGGTYNDKVVMFLVMWTNASLMQEGYEKTVAQGKALHFFGDMYAHQKMGDNPNKEMYPVSTGHGVHSKMEDWFGTKTTPDKIAYRPWLYQEYVTNLVGVLGGRDKQIDMFIFGYITRSGLSTEGNVGAFRSELARIKKAGVVKYQSEEEARAGFDYLAERMKSDGEKNEMKRLSLLKITTTSTNSDGEEVKTESWEVKIEYKKK